ncbi:MAG: TolC family protein [Planctomycetota bacterium]
MALCDYTRIGLVPAAHGSGTVRFGFPRCPKRSTRFAPTAVLIVCAVLTLAAMGCTRGHYRRQADQEVYDLIGCAARDPRWDLKDYGIDPNPASRYYNPFCPDFPPMPPDDPVSHELMHCVDCKKGYPCWHKNGDTPYVENPRWQQYLPRNEKGEIVLDRRMAVQVALVNSRDYQNELEDLYLSALDVTFQRFRFDAQFFGGNSTFFTADGPLRSGNSRSELNTTNDLQLRKLNTFGGQLAVDIANQFVWQFAGPDDHSARTLLDFSLIQPLLRGAGRDVVLENLTDVERALLANVRQMERFRKEFYAQVIVGRGLGGGPARGGLAVGSLFPTFPGATGGLFGLLSEQVRIRNQRFNVSGLRDSLDQIIANYEAGRIDRLQLDQGRQALYSAQSQLLSLETGYEDRLDTYKIALGLPPDLEIFIDDPILRPFNLIDPALTALDDRSDELLNRLRENADAPEGQFVQELAELQAGVESIIEILAQDFEKLEKALPDRIADLRRLADRPEVRDGTVETGLYDPAALNARVGELKRDFAEYQQYLAKSAAAVEALARGAAEPPMVKDRLLPLAENISLLILDLMLAQASVRLETLVLTPVEIEPEEAIRIARENRLDWMNARAALVDSWRQIQVVANALKSDLDVTFSGDITTIDDNPVRFRGTTGRLRVGFEFDAPLTRLVERNAYREVLISYQRARRSYYTFEDRIAQILRSLVRSMRQTQLDFEIRRAGVRVAISQVELTRERLQAPPAVGATRSSLGSTTVRDLVQAYSGLLSAQDGIVNAWVGYETDRMNLVLDMGVMQLDQNGMWIDPGPVLGEEARTRKSSSRPEEVPLPTALPLEDALNLPMLDPIDAPDGALPPEVAPPAEPAQPLPPTPAVDAPAALDAERATQPGAAAEPNAVAPPEARPVPPAQPLPPGDIAPQLMRLPQSTAPRGGTPAVPQRPRYPSTALRDQ